MAEEEGNINTKKIAMAAQEFMAALEGSPDYDSENEIVEVGITVEIRTPIEEGNDGDHRSGTPTYCTNPSRVYQTGLFQWATDSVQFGEPGDDIPDPPEASPEP